ncbi:MFS transporter [Sphingomonas histidinilytica]|uniref:Predicted arabinose efflux permease, MFS family n=1 Tax=Rhizorhabdus histidinilytica TaxID=439228 RepID=A0A1T5ASK2_9SPHN|nr:MFS transporter [Rhizorhabdus histidinilytica]MBO9376910.1 MFS transporter [Rhizorhabdus histidinilytica]SKB37807.1 Predicted arabinose efflux permease, MFS family [Rhizorhabdus histidinilytica]
MSATEGTGTMERPQGARWAAAIPAMMAGACSIGLIFTALTPVLPKLSAQFGGGKVGAEIAGQMVMSVPAIGLILGGIGSGWLIERVGARRLLLASLLLYALCGSAGLWVGDLWALFVSRTLLGFFTACISTSANSFIGEFFDEKGRGRMLSAMTVVGSLLATCAVLMSGWFGEHVGWRAPFAIYLIVPAILFTLAAIGLPAIPIRTSAHGGAGQGVFLRNWPIYLMIGALYVVLMMTSTQISYLLTERGITSPIIQSRVISMAFAWLIVGAIFYGTMQGRIGWAPTYYIGLLSLGLGIGGLGFAPDAWLAGAATALKGFGAGILSPAFIHLVLNRSTPETRGRALGLMTTSMFVGDLANPIVVAPFRAVFGMHGAFISLGSLVLLGAVMAFFTGLGRKAPPAAGQRRVAA